MAERFGNASLEDISSKQQNIHAKTTLKANKKAANALKEYCKAKGMNGDIENYDKESLNKLLTHYYIDARKSTGEKYRVSSLENIRFSLNLFFQMKNMNENFDIIKDKEFRDANLSFRAAITELKREGKGDVKHHPVISENHLQLIYNSECLATNTPTRLQNKVQFDIRFYFARRGAENMHSMTKETFVLRIDSNTNQEFIAKAQDELVKNHRT